MSAASAFQALNIHKAKLPYTAKKGGSSKSEPGQGNDDRVGFVPGMDSIYGRKITTGDRVGAGIVTALFMAFWLGGGFWLMFL
jgi:mannan endo-1,6-alpha-mannosidase